MLRLGIPFVTSRINCTIPPTISFGHVLMYEEFHKSAIRYGCLRIHRKIHRLARTKPWPHLALLPQSCMGW